ncbi:hypothetical protein Tco_0231752 [Tanacetum coccineum]
MGTKVTSSSGSVLEEPEIQKLQMQAKIFRENSLNELNALKSTTQLLDIQSIWYQQAFARLFGDSFRTFKFQLSQHMNNLETLLNAETLHEMDSKSALSVIKVQFERFINSDLLKPLDIYSRSFSSDREVIETFRDYTKMTAQTFKETIIQNMNSIEQCIIERASHEQELKMTLKKLSERQLQIQQCKVQEVQSSVTSSGDETSSGIVSDEEIDKQKLEAHYSYMAKIQEVSPEESSSTSQPLEQVQNHDENDVFANVRRHSEQPESINDTYVLEKDDSNVIPDSSNICTNDNQVDQNAAECVDERAALANLIANLTLDTEENKTILKQLKKANASLTQEWFNQSGGWESSGGNHRDQAKEIKHLKAHIKKLKKKAKPVITHHRGRKSAKAEPTVHKDPAFDKLDDNAIDYMETEDAQDVGRTRYVVHEEKESAKKEVSTEDALGTDNQKVSTDKEEVSIDRPEEGTDKQKVSTDKEEVSTDRPNEGTVDQTEGRSVTPTTPTPTPTTFGDDETITQVLLNMSQAKAVSREKKKRVELKDVENIERPRPTSTRYLLTLKPLPKIDPNDKGKKKIEEDGSDTKSEDINETKKKFKMLAHDEEIARKMQEDWEAEAERKRLAKEEATNAALIQDFDDIKARIKADRLLALRLQEEEERAVHYGRKSKIPS